MSSTLLQLVQQAAGEMGLAVPSTVIGNTAQDTVQMLYLINAVGNEVARQHPWQAMNKQHIFQVDVISLTATSTDGSSNLTNASSIVGVNNKYQVSGLGMNQATYVSGTPSGTTIGLSQPATSTNVGATYTLTQVKYPMPADYDRQIDRTHWDKSKHWEMLGPETPQQWEWLISGYISTGPRVRYRIFAGYFQIWPALGDEEVLGFEYVSTSWVSVTGAGNTDPTKSSFTVDTDTCIFPDRVMVLGLKKKYFEIKGFDPSAFTRDYMMELDIAKTADAGSATLSMSPRQASVLISAANIPDSNYGTN